MRLWSRTCLLILVSAACSGCLSAVTVVKVKPDGSGTIEQSLSMRKELADQLAGMMAGFADKQDGAKPGAAPELFTEAQMRDAAPKLGEGVTFVSSKAVTAPDRVGRVAVYAFKDISKLRIDQKPSTPGPAGAMGMAPARGGAPAENVSFTFAKLSSGNSLVTVLFPEPKVNDDAKKAAHGKSSSGPAHKPTAEQVEMMKKMFDGLRIEMALEVQGTLVKTNSAYASGNRVTLLEMDFAELLKNDALMQQMAGEPKSLEEAKAVLKSIKGFKLNLDKQVDVEFR
jgi:hypothetical protein